ncbi:MAG TPA: alpha/beta hydrolase [Vicinamibacterales bacterium]|nr:alpha/beta hydrolase [Vicinamibacterales bacterium]
MHCRLWAMKGAARAQTIVLLLAALAGSAGAAQRGPAGPAAVPADKFVTSNGLRIHYVDWGNPGAPPLILIHGLDRVARTFDHLATHFTSRFHVIALDMRGHGDSGWDPEGRYLVEDHAGDLDGLVRQLGLRNITVWGNSTGGRVAQVFAGMYPDLVSRVISEDVGPERPRQISDSYSRRVAQEEAGWASEEELLGQLRKTSSGTSDAVLVPYVRYGTKRRADGRIIWKRDPKLVNGFVPTDLWRFVREIKAPALYVIGGRSTIVPRATQDELKKVLPKVQIVTMPGLGHYPSDEKPEEFLAIVDEFLSKT